MKGEVILSNRDGTVGFLHLEKFEGVTTDIDLGYLKEAIKTLDYFQDKGLVPERITLGIATESFGQPSTAIFFLDRKQKCGIAIAPLLHNKEEKEE